MKQVVTILDDDLIGWIEKLRDATGLSESEVVRTIVRITRIATSTPMGRYFFGLALREAGLEVEPPPSFFVPLNGTTLN